MISIKNIGYNNGDKWPPWGTPEVTGKVSEKKLLIFTRRDLSTKDKLNQDNEGSFMPNKFNFLIMTEWFTESNVLLKFV